MNQPLIHQLQYHLRQSTAVSVLISQTIADKVGLTPKELESLDFLIQNHSATAGQLAAITGLTSGAITGIIDRLETKGYARRKTDKTDRRKTIVVPNISKINQDILPLYQPLLESSTQLASKFSQAELKIIVDFFQRSFELGRNHLNLLQNR